jgi:hypothetical protein
MKIEQMIVEMRRNPVIVETGQEKLRAHNERDHHGAL